MLESNAERAAQHGTPLHWRRRLHGRQDRRGGTHAAGSVRAGSLRHPCERGGARSAARTCEGRASFALWAGAQQLPKLTSMRLAAAPQGTQRHRCWPQPLACRRLASRVGAANAVSHPRPAVCGFQVVSMFPCSVKLGPSSPAELEAALAKTSVMPGVALRAEDVAAGMLFLASDMGRCVNVRRPACAGLQQGGYASAVVSTVQFEFGSRSARTSCL